MKTLEEYRLICKNLDSEGNCTDYFMSFTYGRQTALKKCTECMNCCKRMINHQKKLEQIELAKEAKLTIGTVAYIIEYGNCVRETEVRGFTKRNGVIRYKVKGHLEYTYSEDDLFPTREDAENYVAQKEINDAIETLARYKDKFQVLGYTPEKVNQLLLGE